MITRNSRCSTRREVVRKRRLLVRLRVRVNKNLAWRSRARSRARAGVLAWLPIFVILGCTPKSGPGTITQASPIAGLLAGSYDGWLSGSELLTYGDFGIGTFDRLDGEMVIDHGRIYQVRADGRVSQPPRAAKVPFAVAVHFSPSSEIPLEHPLTLAQLYSFIDSHLTSKNLFYAVRLEGEFEFVRTRSVPAQSPPYPPLVEVTKQQRVFTLEHEKGVLVGFRTPAYAGGVNVPGYHLHFLCDGARCGGHVLDLRVQRGVVQIAAYRELHMLLPPAESSFGKANLEDDRSEELHRAEREPEPAMPK